MTLEQAIKVLDLHNQWRKGANIEMQKPSEIGEAIDVALNILKGINEKPKPTKDISSTCKRKGCNEPMHEWGLCFKHHLQSDEM